MEVNCTFDHYNFNVLDLEKSLDFYKRSIGLKEKFRREAEDGSYILVFLEDGSTNFSLELTWLRDWNRPYELGDNEVHLCMRVEADYAKVREYHRENGWICYENEKMGIYFIADPDNHWVEILPVRK